MTSSSTVVNHATNACRALTTNWLGGKLWGQFSSQVYKDRYAAGNMGYRTMPLSGIWATSPFLHNPSIGELPPDARERDQTRPRAWGPFNPDPRLLGDIPVGGSVRWRVDPEWITIAPSWMATEQTYVSFEGRTAYGERSRLPGRWAR